MKRWLLCLLIVVTFGCTKEKNTPSLVGRWTLIETVADCGLTRLTYSPSSELTVQFYPNGTLFLQGTNPGKAGSDLWKFNRYEVLSDYEVRFFHSQTGVEARATFLFENGLIIGYDRGRGGWGETFIRL